MTDVPALEARSLRLVSPSLAAALGVPGFANELGMVPARSVGVLLVDGLGAELLSDYAAHAPVLSELATSYLSAGFPATTSTSVSALGTGLHAGEHGIVGYTFRAGTDDPVLNTLRWCAHANKDYPDLRDVVIPETLQPRTTVFERLAAAGVTVTRVVPKEHVGSGLTRAVLRGPATDVTANNVDELAAGLIGAMTGWSFTYAYYGGVDLAGHIFGPGSPEWLEQLRAVDATVARIAENLGPDALLAIVADHGMIDTGEDRIDLDEMPELTAHLTEIGGEPRVRHLHTVAGAADDVYDAWRSIVGDRAWIVRREEALAAGWYGPRVADAALERLGDVIVAANGNWTFVRSSAEPMETALRGHHGSWTTREQFVPLVQIRT